MSRAASLVSGLILVPLFLAVFAVPGWTASDQFCSEYANRALEDFRAATELGCPDLRFPVWSVDFDHHFNWCRGVSAEETRFGSQQRAEVLSTCQAATGEIIGTITTVAPTVDLGRLAATSRQTECVTYAQSAIAQQAENEGMKCGLRSPAWNPRYEDHYNWCMTLADPQPSRDGQRMREEALDSCAAARGVSRAVRRTGGIGGVSVTPLPIPSPAVTPIPIPSPAVTPLPIPSPAVTPIPIPSPGLDPGLGDRIASDSEVQEMSLLVATLPSGAASEEFCREYATEALDQYRQAQAMNCPDLTYPVWSMDFDHHYSWCRGVPEGETRVGRQLRLDALSGCRPAERQGIITGVIEMVDGTAAISAALQKSCLDYAVAAVAQQANNVERGCGFSGPSWNPNQDDHFAWCMRGENLQYTQGELRSRQEALNGCAGQVRQVAPLPLTPNLGAASTTPPRLATVDVSGFPGGMLMIDAMRAATAPAPDCSELRSTLLSMIGGGGFARTVEGSLGWRGVDELQMRLDDPRVQAILNRTRVDLNSQLRDVLDLRRGERIRSLGRDFSAAPSSAQQVAAVTDALAANLRPDKLARLEQMSLSDSASAGGDPLFAQIVGTQLVMAGLDQASAAKIRQVCSLADGGASAPGQDATLWENGYAFLLGSHFGWQAGDIYLEYEACGGAARRCEDLRLSGRPIPVQRLRLEPISRFAWTDRLIGIKLPSKLPAELVAGTPGPRIWVRTVAGGSPIASPPLRFNHVAPDVWSVKTDSGFDPGGLLFDGHWVSWSDPKQVRHDIFWVWSQKLIQGAGLVQINCPTCRKGKRVESAHLLGPGDNLYILGDGFGAQPGDILLTYDDPTRPGVNYRSLQRSIPLETGGGSWWRDDRIHVRVPTSTTPPSSRRFPYLVIADRNGRWISGRFGLSFAPPMAVKVVSGKTWFDLGTGEGDTAVPASDGSSMIVSHPTGGCASLWVIPVDTNERGADRFFHKGRPRAEIQVLRAEFAHLSPTVSDGQFLAKWGRGLFEEVAKYGVIGFFTYMGRMALGNGLRSIAGDNGRFYIYPQKQNGSDARDPRFVVDWENTCTGPYEDQTIKYAARFVLAGPRHLLYPGR